jgi:flagellar FliJ protein
MRRFRFRLERFLQLRRYDEREWELKLAEATGKCLRIQQGIADRQSDIARTVRERPRELGVVDMNLYYAAEMYVERLDREIAGMTEDLVVQEAKRRKVQEGYLEASKRRKVLEKLKEKREARHRKEQNKEEFNTLNDLNTNAFRTFGGGGRIG